MPWSISFVLKHLEKWEWFTLGQGLISPMPSFWTYVFQPIVNERLITETLKSFNHLNLTANNLYTGSNFEDKNSLVDANQSILKLKKLIDKLQ